MCGGGDIVCGRESVWERECVGECGRECERMWERVSGRECVAE